MPAEYGDWRNNHRRFCRWRDKNEWERLLEILIYKPEDNDRRVPFKDFYPHAAGAKVENQDMERIKGAQFQNSPHDMPVRMFVTAGTITDCKFGKKLVTGISADFWLTDKGYDTNEIFEFANSKNMEVVIPPKKNRKIQRPYDKYLYKLRYLVENAFCT
ncbi:MAG: IS5 family transposase [Candidatus Paraimprobicoccus trichonymphae]|uniref:IS5 family transposase n=1 Tax=Candidatus Paraimprobicoccus trichonymphae TaxID=3033793 RepID=A0AA48L1I6_9FIRM|nr:MAG: IS5 family transposase [Candidatus Paraimprobicoccus trichonymphae]